MATRADATLLAEFVEAEHPRDDHGRFTGFNKELTDYVDAVHELRGRMPKPPGIQYSPEGYLKEHGKIYESQPLTDEERAVVKAAMGKKKYKLGQCFMNAQQIAMNAMGDKRATVEYVEGFTVSKLVPVPIHHAWVTVNGKVVDPTIRHEGGATTFGEFPNTRAYYGVPFTNEEVVAEQLRTRYYGPLLHAPKTLEGKNRIEHDATEKAKATPKTETPEPAPEPPKPAPKSHTVHKFSHREILALELIEQDLLELEGLGRGWHTEEGHVPGAVAARGVPGGRLSHHRLGQVINYLITKHGADWLSALAKLGKNGVQIILDEIDKLLPPKPPVHMPYGYAMGNAYRDTLFQLYSDDQPRDNIGRWTDVSSGIIGGDHASVRTETGPGAGAGRSALPAPAAQGRPAPSQAVAAVANSYNAANGRPPVVHAYVEVNQTRAGDIADAYDALPFDDSANPAVEAAYKALATEVQAQWDHATASGVHFEPWTKDGQPYQSSKEMAADVADHQHLYFYTGGEPGKFMAAKDASGLSINDKFRAVHDYFGHAAGGYGFGPRGEENAWIAHSQMFSDAARQALTTETRGQNSWVNFGRQNYAADGTYKNIPQADRPFAAQKTALLPERFLAIPSEAFVKHLAMEYWLYSDDQPRDEAGRWTDAGISAFHGSPHDFDKFDAEHLGTGEGAAAYGHGLYFAENQDIAKTYRDDLTFTKREKNSIFYKGREVPPGVAEHRILLDIADRGKDATIGQIERNIKFNKDYAPDQAALGETHLAIAKAVDPADIKLAQGRLYSVGIHAKPDEFLDWDQPIRQQPAAMARLAQMPQFAKRIQDADELIRGEHILAELANDGGQEKAARALSAVGFKGIRYLDHGSRATGDGTRNYVVFDPSIVQIVKKLHDVADAMSLSYDEAKHPRDDHGRWTDVGEGALRSTWQASLSPDERSAVNQWLHRGPRMDPMQMPTFERAIARAPQFEGKIYRGTTLGATADEISANLEQLFKTREVDLRGPASFTADKDVAHVYGSDVLYVADQASGRDLRGMTAGGRFESEDEIVALRGTRYAVTKIAYKAVQFKHGQKATTFIPVTGKEAENDLPHRWYHGYYVVHMKEIASGTHDLSVSDEERFDLLFDEAKHPRDERGRWTGDGRSGEFDDRGGAAKFLKKQPSVHKATDPNLTNFILPNGSRLGTNTSHARAAGSYDMLNRLLGDGIIRYQPGKGAEMGSVPTWEQADTIAADFINEFKVPLAVDVIDRQGRLLDTQRFDQPEAEQIRTFVSRVLTAHYATAAKPDYVPSRLWASKFSAYRADPVERVSDAKERAELATYIKSRRSDPSTLTHGQTGYAGARAMFYTKRMAEPRQPSRMPIAASNSYRERLFNLLYDESQHPRDDKGMWVESGGERQYLEAVGTTRTPEQAARLKELKARPDLTDIFMATDPKADLQVVGKDSKGRTQYLYTAEHTARAAAEKFERMKAFDAVLPKLKDQIQQDMATDDAALILHIIDQTAFRIGSTSDTGAEKEAIGVSTLRAAHVKVDGDKVAFSFPSKSGGHAGKSVTDAKLASILAPRIAAAAGTRGKPLFTASAGDVRDYMEQHAPGFSPKDFRTRTGTATALALIAGRSVPKTDKARKAAVKDVATRVARVLGNTPAVALKSYIDPAVFSAWRPQ